jgi:Uncharacterised nucleotidyltransferase
LHVSIKAAELASLLRDPTQLHSADALDASVVAAAREHGVAPLLYVALRDVGMLANVAPAIRDAFARDAREAMLVDSCRRPHVARLLADLADAGITALVFKGAPLAHTHYEQPWLRLYTDVDLLVRDEDMDAAATRLERIGCVRLPRPHGAHVTHQFTCAGSFGGVTVAYDVHRRIADPHVFADVLPFDDLLRDSIHVPQLGPSVRAPCAVHALAIACIHRVAHHYDADTLFQIVDIDRLARQFEAGDWIRFTALAQAGAIRAVCARGLTLSHAWLGTPLPENVLDALRTNGDERTAAYLRDGFRKVDILASDLNSLPTWRLRVALLREHLFPPADYLLSVSDHNNRATLPFLYARRIVRGARAWFLPLRQSGLDRQDRQDGLDGTREG